MRNKAASRSSIVAGNKVKMIGSTGWPPWGSFPQFPWNRFER